MSVTIVVCPCGSRLKAAGMVSGKSGRCPSCGRTLRMPEAEGPAVSDEDVCAMLRLPEPAPAEEPAPARVPAPVVEEEDEWNWKGIYELDPAEPPRPKFGPIELDRVEQPPGPWPDDEPRTVGDEPRPEVEASEPSEPAETQASLSLSASAAEGEWTWSGMYDLDAPEPAPVAPAGPPEPAPVAPAGPPEAPPAVGDAEVHPAAAPVGWDSKGAHPKSARDEPRSPDPWWPPRLLYPLRGAESLAMVSILGGIAWVMGTLIPEYCLGILADADLLGTPSMGRLVVLISAIPVMVLTPLALIYALQYLARVLVAASEGEPQPPRPPDRNADGLLNGMGFWLLWLILGVTVGLLPVTAYSLFAASRDQPLNLVVMVALGAFGIPYALLALMMTFLHDDALAARPGAVLGTIARLGPSFLGLSLTIVALACLGAGAFAAMLVLRSAAFWVYIPASLVCWLLAVWLSIVAMHTMGAYYAARTKLLKWRRKRLRWGAS